MLDGYEEYSCQDWDGYGAEPITAETLAVARGLANIMASKVEVAPGADGSIGFEWVTEDGKVFLDVGPGARLSIYARVGETILCKAAK